MSTTIRPEIAKNKLYWIPKHKYYELKHFCLQYNDWKKAKQSLINNYKSPFGEINYNSALSDPTSATAIMISEYDSKIELVEKKAKEADNLLYAYILIAVTNGRSYEYIQTHNNVPASRDTFYNRYRRFFWLLSKER